MCEAQIFQLLTVGGNMQRFLLMLFSYHKLCIMNSIYPLYFTTSVFVSVKVYLKSAFVTLIAAILFCTYLLNCIFSVYSLFISSSCHVLSWFVMYWNNCEAWTYLTHVVMLSLNCNHVLITHAMHNEYSTLNSLTTVFTVAR